MPIFKHEGSTWIHQDSNPPFRDLTDEIEQRRASGVPPTPEKIEQALRFQDFANETREKLKIMVEEEMAEFGIDPADPDAFAQLCTASAMKGLVDGAHQLASEFNAQAANEQLEDLFQGLAQRE